MVTYYGENLGQISHGYDMVSGPMGGGHLMIGDHLCFGIRTICANRGPISFSIVSTLRKQSESLIVDYVDDRVV